MGPPQGAGWQLQSTKSMRGRDSMLLHLASYQSGKRNHCRSCICNVQVHAGVPHRTCVHATLVQSYIQGSPWHLLPLHREPWERQVRRDSGSTFFCWGGMLLLKVSLCRAFHGTMMGAGHGAAPQPPNTQPPPAPPAARTCIIHGQSKGASMHHMWAS